MCVSENGEKMLKAEKKGLILERQMEICLKAEKGT